MLQYWIATIASPSRSRTHPFAVRMNFCFYFVSELNGWSTIKMEKKLNKTGHGQNAFWFHVNASDHRFTCLRLRQKK